MDGTHHELWPVLEKCGAKMERKEEEACFVLSAGWHAKIKYNFGRVFQYPLIRARFANAFAQKFARSSLVQHVSLVAGPESVGPFLAELQRCREFRKIKLALAKKTQLGFWFEDALDISASDNCLIFDDVFTTGKTLVLLARALKDRASRLSAAAPPVIGSGVLVNRFPRHPELPPYVPAPCVSLLYDRHDVKNFVYTPDACPFCKKE